LSSPADALRDLAALLSADGSVVSPHVTPSEARIPALGELVSRGARTAPAPGEYALVVETVREGFLLHYASAEARVVRDVDPDLALLAGDYLYALGLERLSALADLDAVRELSDLISLVAQLHDGSRDPARTALESSAVWLACTVAIAAGPAPAHEAAKAEVRADSGAAAAALWAAAGEAAQAGGFREALDDAAAQLDFQVDHLSALG
jgi:hypothetical protein